MITKAQFYPAMGQVLYAAGSVSRNAAIKPGADVYFGAKKALDPDSPRLTRGRRQGLLQYIPAGLFSVGGFGISSLLLDSPSPNVAIPFALIGLGGLGMGIHAFWVNSQDKKFACESLFYRSRMSDKPDNPLNGIIDRIPTERREMAANLVNGYLSHWQKYSDGQIAKSGERYCKDRDTELYLILAFCAMPLVDGDENRWMAEAREQYALLAAGPKIADSLIQFVTAEIVDTAAENWLEPKERAIDDYSPGEKQLLHQWKQLPDNRLFIELFTEAVEHSDTFLLSSAEGGGNFLFTARLLDVVSEAMNRRINRRLA